MSWDPPSSRPGPPLPPRPSIPVGDTRAPSAWAPPPPWAAPTPLQAPPARGGGRWSLLGAVVTGGALIVALVLGATISGARAQTISQFARAAAGCRTTIDVTDAATYLVVSEVRGALDAVDGSCPATAGRFDLGGSTAPAVGVVVRAADGTRIEVVPRTGGSYDTGTYAGAVAGSVALVPGRYEVEVTSSASRAVVAIGVDPQTTERRQRTAAAVVAAAGVASGMLLMATGRRRRRR